MEKESGGFYQTFDSGSGPVIPSGSEKDFAHNDAPAALSDKDEDLAVPEVKSSKK